MKVFWQSLGGALKTTADQRGRVVEVYPSKMKNLARAAAAAAARAGFAGISWAEIAKTCASEATCLVDLGAGVVPFGTASNSLETLAALLFLL